MKIVSMTEFNQHPSRVARLAMDDEVVVLRRGKAALRIIAVSKAAAEDPLDQLIRAGVAYPPRSERRRTDPFPSVNTTADLGAMLDSDRGGLNA